jgi:hypothetical protein
MITIESIKQIVEIISYISAAFILVFVSAKLLYQSINNWVKRKLGNSHERLESKLYELFDHQERELKELNDRFDDHLGKTAR